MRSEKLPTEGAIFKFNALRPPLRDCQWRRGPPGGPQARPGGLNPGVSFFGDGAWAGPRFSAAALSSSVESWKLLFCV